MRNFSTLLRKNEGVRVLKTIDVAYPSERVAYNNDFFLLSKATFRMCSAPVLQRRMQCLFKNALRSTRTMSMYHSGDFDLRLWSHWWHNIDRLEHIWQWGQQCSRCFPIIRRNVARLVCGMRHMAIRDGSLKSYLLVVIVSRLQNWILSCSTWRRIARHV